MPEIDVATETGAQLDRITDFRYFLFFGALVLYMDFYLVLFKGFSLSQLKYSGSLEGFQVGGVLIFVASFGFLVTFVVSASLFLFRAIAMLIPGSCSDQSMDNLSLNDKIKFSYPFQILNYSVTNNNSIAYEIYKSEIEDGSSRKRLYTASLAFLYASLLNVYASVVGEISANPIGRFLYGAIQADYSFLITVVAMFVCCFYLFLIWIGIFSSACDSGRYRSVYFPAGATVAAVRDERKE